METKKRRYVRRTPESYRKEVRDITDGEYSVLGEFSHSKDKLPHIHSKCGYVWDISPSHFVRGRRCPKCRGRVWRTPESYRKEVEDVSNGEYFVLDEFSNSHSKINHLHIFCGKIWEVSPNDFLNKMSRCPDCYIRGRISRSTDSYRLEVNKITEGRYSVEGRFVNMSTKIKHVHNTCGHTWNIAPKSFVNDGTRCPKCADSKRSLKSTEEFEVEVYNLVGNEYTFLEPYSKGDYKIKVTHNTCGCVYSVSPKVFLQGSRCPICVSSRGEKAVADVLDSLSIEYSREHTFEYLGRKRYDFFIPSLNIAIEYDGEQHFKAVDHWGGEEALKRTQESDALKNDFCDFMGIDLLRIPYWDFDNIDEIVTNFIDTVKLMRSISDRKEA